MAIDEIIFRRKIRRAGYSAFKLSLPPEVAQALGGLGADVALIVKNEGVLLAPFPLECKSVTLNEKI